MREGGRQHAKMAEQGSASSSYFELNELHSDLPNNWAPGADDWDLASTATAGETGPGGGHNFVAPGELGAEYRSMKQALGAETSRGTPQRDPYHGRTTDPKCAARLPCTPTCEPRQTHDAVSFPLP